MSAKYYILFVTRPLRALGTAKCGLGTIKGNFRGRPTGFLLAACPAPQLACFERGYSEAVTQDGKKSDMDGDNERPQSPTNKLLPI